MKSFLVTISRISQLELWLIFGLYNQVNGAQFLEKDRDFSLLHSIQDDKAARAWS
jgi:hypothetical protein